MQTKTTLLIADDHAIVRDGLVALFQSQREFKVVAEAEDGRAAVARAAETKPDVAILDLMMPFLDGADATREVLAVSPETKVLLLTTYGSSARLLPAFENGATGAITKNLSGAELFAAVRDIAAGKRVVSAEIKTTLAAESDAPELTPRQREMLAALVEGLANKDIVRQTGLSPSSVKFHLAELFRRLGVSTRAEAVAVAHKKQLFKIPS